MKKWKVGDVVQLPSGGPKMTVTGPYAIDSITGIEPGMVACVWLDAAGEQQTGGFPESALVSADAD